MAAPALKLIYARAANGVIGLNNALPWHVPEDLAHFKQLTQGCPVLMGRRTWDSLPARFRPLPGRRNIVLSHAADWQAEGALRVASLAEALALCGAAPLAWVIGGAQLFSLAEPLACEAEVTEIHHDFAGDAYAPPLGPHWREVARSRQPRSAEGLSFSFVRYLNTLARS